MSNLNLLTCSNDRYFGFVARLCESWHKHMPGQIWIADAGIRKANRQLLERVFGARCLFFHKPCPSIDEFLCLRILLLEPYVGKESFLYLDADCVVQQPLTIPSEIDVGIRPREHSLFQRRVFGGCIYFGATRGAASFLSNYKLRIEQIGARCWHDQQTIWELRNRLPIRWWDMDASFFSRSGRRGRQRAAILTPMRRTILRQRRTLYQDAIRKLKS
jgi:hypothetical protein